MNCQNDPSVSSCVQMPGLHIKPLFSKTCRLRHCDLACGNWHKHDIHACNGCTHSDSMSHFNSHLSNCNAQQIGPLTVPWLNFRSKSLSSCGQPFWALVNFRLLLIPGPCCGFVGGGAFGGPAVVVLETFGTEEGTGSKYMVTLGCVVSGLKAWFRAGTSFVGFNDSLYSCARIVHSSRSALITCSLLTGL